MDQLIEQAVSIAQEKDIQHTKKIPLDPSLLDTYSIYEQDIIANSEKKYEDLSLPEIDRICKKALRMTERFAQVKRVLPTIKPALMLYTFNLIKDNPSLSGLDTIKALKHIDALFQDEEDAAKNASLPPIGIEVEVSEKRFPLGSPYFRELADWFEKAGIPIEKDFDPHEPTEFRLPPSYSAHVQARMLHELRKAGFVPINNRSFASLHINLGFPADLLRRGRDIFDLSDVLTYAFVPARRVESYSYTEAVELHGKRDDVIPIQKDRKLYDQRVEFRTPRVSGPNTYRLLDEAQQIGSLYVGEGKQYETIRREFIDDVMKLRMKYFLPLNAPTDAYQEAANAIQEAKRQKEQGEQNLIDDARHIMWFYAQKAQTLNQMNLSPKLPTHS